MQKCLAHCVLAIFPFPLNRNRYLSVAFAYFHQLDNDPIETLLVI